MPGEVKVDASLEELRRCREELGTFVYIVSHDLRSPLINLKGFSAELRSALEVVQSAVAPLLPQVGEDQQAAVITALEEDIPESLSFIDSSVNRIDRFLNAILKLSRWSHRELRFESLSMDALVQQALDGLNDEIERQQATVRLTASLPDVVADRAAMKEVVGNVLSNAVLYLVSDRPGEVEIAGERRADETVFTVRDNGRGIAEEDMHKVFEPFRRAGRQDVPGQGMGLVYAQALVRRHGGRMTCTSGLGEGTEVAFSISNHLGKGDDHVY